MGNFLPPQEFEDLSTQENIEYVEALWDSVVREAEKAPITDWQKRLLDERLADLERSQLRAEAATRRSTACQSLLGRIRDAAHFVGLAP